MDTEREQHIQTKQHKIKVKHHGEKKRLNILLQVTKTHAFLTLFFCFLITAATKNVLISDRICTRSGNFGLNKVGSCVIHPSFQINVACGSVSINKNNSPQLSASIQSSWTLFTLQLSQSIGRRKTRGTQFHKPDIINCLVQIIVVRKKPFYKYQQKEINYVFCCGRTRKILSVHLTMHHFLLVSDHSKYTTIPIHQGQTVTTVEASDKHIFCSSFSGNFLEFNHHLRLSR